jgi:hypothetical protein
LSEHLVVPRRKAISPQHFHGDPAVAVSDIRRESSRLASFIRWIGFMAVGFVALLGRPIHSSELLSLWGEDGVIFMQQARTLGIVRSFTTTYTGYLHFYPRSVAAVAAALPITWTPVIFLVGAMACASLCATIAWNSGRALGLSPVNSILLAGWVLFIPAAGFEIVNTLTNVQWFILPTAIVFLAAWANGYRPPTLLACMLLGVGILTAPLVAILLPFAFVMSFVHRKPEDIWLTIVLALGTAAQGLARIVSGAGSHQGTINPAQLARWYAVRVVGGSFLGSRLVHKYFTAVTSPGTIAVAVGLITLFILVSLRANLPPLRWIGVGLLVGSLLLLAGTMVVRSDTFRTSPNAGFVKGSPILSGGRYVAGPGVCIFLVGLLCLELWRRSTNPAWFRMIFEVVTGLIVVLLVSNIPVELYRSPSAAWTSQVRQERTACRSNSGSGTVHLVNSPGDPWVAVMTCRQAFG